MVAGSNLEAGSSVENTYSVIRFFDCITGAYHRITGLKSSEFKVQSSELVNYELWTLNPELFKFQLLQFSPQLHNFHRRRFTVDRKGW